MAITTKALQQLVNRFAGQRVAPMSGPVPCLRDDGIFGANTLAGVQRVLELLRYNWVWARVPLPRATGGIWGTTYVWEPYVSKFTPVTAGKFAEYLSENWNNKVGTASNLPVGEFLQWTADFWKQTAPAGCTGAAPSSGGGGGGGGGGSLPPPQEQPPPPTAQPDAPLDIFGVKVSRPVAYAAGGVLVLLVGALVLKRKRA
jgi:hypothetical protein